MFISDEVYLGLDLRFYVDAIAVVYSEGLLDKEELMQKLGRAARSMQKFIGYYVPLTTETDNAVKSYYAKTQGASWEDAHANL